MAEELAALKQAIQNDAWAAMSWPNGSGPSDPGNPCGL
jgi:hypothetical protein